MIANDRFAELVARCFTHHSVDIQVHLLDMSGNFIQAISSGLIDGSIDIDADASITRSAQLRWFDPGGSINLNLNNVNESGGYLSRQIRVYYGVGNLTSDPDYIYVPVFTGPVVNLSRDGVYLSINAQGKELLSSDGMIQEYVFAGGSWLRDVVIWGMQGFCGEVNFDLAHPPNILGGDLAFEPGDNLFEILRTKCADIGYQLFYNGWGNLVLRANPQASVFTFDGRCITQNPSIEYADSEVTNCVRVEGGQPVGATHPIVVFMYAPEWHPLGPVRLGRNGVPRFLPEFITEDSISSYVEAFGVASVALENGLMRSVSAQFTSLTMPFIEESDIVTVSGTNYFGNTRATKMTIPLVGDADMSVGFLSRKSEGIVISSAQGMLNMRIAAMQDRKIQEAHSAILRNENQKKLAEARKKREEARAKKRKEAREKKRKLKKTGEKGVFENQKKNKRSKKGKR